MEQSFLQRGGHLLAEDCLSKFDGGGLHILGSFSQVSSSSTRLTSCKAQRGGCMSVNGSVDVSGSNAFHRCVAFEDRDAGRILGCMLLWNWTSQIFKACH